MKRWLAMALRALIVLLLTGSLFVQVVMVPLLGADLDGAGPDVLAIRGPFLAIVVAGIATVQVALLCVWRLLTMAAQGTVFSQRAFRYVDVVIGAAVVAAGLAAVLAFILAPGEPVPPGIVLLVCGAAALAAMLALIVLVLRTLLAQAVARDIEARRLQAELDEVI